MSIIIMRWFRHAVRPQLLVAARTARRLAERQIREALHQIAVRTADERSVVPQFAKHSV
jgi:site-specific recombinase XerC